MQEKSLSNPLKRKILIEIGLGFILFDQAMVLNYLFKVKFLIDQQGMKNIFVRKIYYYNPNSDIWIDRIKGGLIL